MKQGYWHIAAISAALGLGCREGAQVVSTSGALCNDTVTRISNPDQTTPLGFRATDIIAFAAGDSSSTIQWSSIPNVTFGPEAGRQSLSLNVAYGGGEVDYVRSLPKEGGGASCSDHLSIAVSVRLQTQGGALDETFDGKLTATTPFFATLTQPLDLEKLTGTFTVMSTTGSAQQLTVQAVLSALGTTGQLTSDIEVSTADSVGVTDVRYGVWPASDACKISGADSPGLPAALDVSIVSFTGQDGLNRFNTAGTALAMGWNDGSSSALSIAATPQGDGCVRFTDSTGASRLLAAFPVQLNAVTADGRLNGGYPAELTITPSGSGDLQTTEGRVDLKLPVDQVAATGFSGLPDVSAYDQLALSLLGQIASGQVTGEIVLSGLKAGTCTTQVPPEGGTTGCPGTSYTLMERGSWQQSTAP
jgi:hypothetical protein